MCPQAEVISCTHIICTKACSHLALEAVLDNLKVGVQHAHRLRSLAALTA